MNSRSAASSEKPPDANGDGDDADADGADGVNGGVASGGVASGAAGGFEYAVGDGWQGDGKSSRSSGRGPFSTGQPTAAAAPFDAKPPGEPIAKPPGEPVVKPLGEADADDATGKSTTAAVDDGEPPGPSDSDDDDGGGESKIKLRGVISDDRSTISARSITFRSSRTFPGQSCVINFAAAAAPIA